MKTLLHLDSSGKGSHSVTKPLTAYFVKQWQAANPGGKVIERDLSQSGIEFITPELVGAFFTPADQISEQQKQLLRQSDELVAELLEADDYVFGVPMYNFAVPGVFKSYVDLIARVGKTFSYKDGAPKGLLTNKKLTVITASGGDYTVEPMKNYDFIEPYIRAFFGFIGVSDIRLIRSHGRDPETIAKNSAEAKARIDSELATSMKA